MQQRLLIILQLLLFALTATAQYADWDKHQGGAREDIIVDIIQDYAGDLVAIGSTKSKAFRSKDILFMKRNRDRGYLTGINNIGGSNQDEAFSIDQSVDGSYIVAGKTNSNWEGSFQKDDAWLLKLDDFGEIEWEIIKGGKADDEFRDVLCLDDGSIVTVGREGTQACIYHFDQNAKMLTTISSKKRGILYSHIIKAADGYIIGGISQSKNLKPFIIKLDETFQKVWEYRPKNLDIWNLADIELKQDSILMCVSSENKSKRSDAAIIKVDPSGKFHSIAHFGGHDHDEIRDLIIKDDELIFTGNTVSHERGARRTDLWIHHVMQEGNQYEFLGGNANDGGESIVALHDGGIAIGGYNASQTLVEKDPWMIVRSSAEEAPVKQEYDIEIVDIAFYDNDRNDTLNFSERGFFEISLKNNSDTTASQLAFFTARSQYSFGIEIPVDVLIPELAASEVTQVFIPVSAAEYIYSVDNTLAFDIREHTRDSIISSGDLSFSSKAKPIPRLQISNARFDTTASNVYHRMEDIKIHFSVQNVGEGPAMNTAVKLSLPFKVESSIDGSISIDTLRPGQTQEFSFTVKAQSIYEFDKIQVNCTAYESEYSSLARAIIEIPLINFYKDGLKVKEEYKTKQRQIFRQEYEKGGPNGEIVFLGFDVSNRWDSPDKFDLGTDFDLEVDYLNIKWDIDSPDSEVNLSDVRLYLNDEVAKPGIHFNGSERKIIGPYGSTYRYVNEIKLSPGKNKFYAMVDIGGKKYKSEIITVNCTIKRPALHLYAIGVPHDDLQFTTKDAQDFADAFDGNEIYSETHIKVVNDSLSTSSNALRELMNSIYNDRFEKESIEPLDKVMLFISSHGFTMRNNSKFRIACSDFNMKAKLKSLDFEADIVDWLSEMIENDIYIFVDACHSGAIGNSDLAIGEDEKIGKSTISNTVNNIVQAKQDIFTVVSSGQGELSYEDDSWKNGAFTLAITEALSNNMIMSDSGIIQADSDGDTKITIQELFEFVKVRVPDIVKTKKPKSDTPQNPFVAEAQLEQPSKFIYQIEKE